MHVGAATGTHAAPLVPAATGHEDRFRAGGPDLEGVAAVKGSSHEGDTAVPLMTMIGALSSAVSKAAVLLNDRLQGLQSKVHSWPPGSLSEVYVRELCEIADGVDAALYALHKWTALLQHRAKPSKPLPSLEVSEAFAVLHSSVPKLMTSANEAQHSLQHALSGRTGTVAEEFLESAGVHPDDVMSLAPHLEILITRIGHLTMRVKAGHVSVDDDVLRKDVSEVLQTEISRLSMSEVTQSGVVEDTEVSGVLESPAA